MTSWYRILILAVILGSVGGFVYLTLPKTPKEDKTALHKPAIVFPGENWTGSIPFICIRFYDKGTKQYFLTCRNDKSVAVTQITGK